ncbi:helix-turn-helix transcriptional regulator [Paraburkholderia sabiae]|uniref:Helix-turn-helix transcriptional regulator n=2 Tax=Paraburkholderia sabiae TaxID=273251 RepID=A0ABU9QSK6_9BURK|nr:helix-turn-helix domain-containing protein [Paraburkholderia sabiae]WJZ79886.1 helix-turn-helix transcriptional regulator [Paraburkholderia sabiae]CAD6563343.1 hypothetical protein LMG24235_08587 [Paraburkholderia sabiae]
MFLTLYFPLIGSLSLQSLPESFLTAMSEGNLRHAAAQIGRSASIRRTPQLLRMHADMQLMLGICDEPEDQYRAVEKAMCAPRRVINAASCRNAGWQAVFRYRLATALSCFARAIEEAENDPNLNVELRLAIAGILHLLGYPNNCARELAELEAATTELPSSLWRQILATLHFDVAVQRELRGSPLLDNHAYWQSGLDDMTPRSIGVKADVRSLRDETDMRECKVLDVRTPLLRQRIDYLRSLRTLAKGARVELDGIETHLNWARHQGLVDYLSTTRVEAALASLAADAPELAERVLEPLRRINYAGSTGHRQLEYLYSLARTQQALGRHREAVDLLGRYALTAAKCLRDDSQIHVSYRAIASSRDRYLDDVAVRLPARYRRAYRYMQQNINRSHLSVRELAAEIGVTERALQLAFKKSLGLSPKQLIRRLRMEGVREDLRNDSIGGRREILSTANKWGVRTYTALVRSYHKQFDESPSDALSRRRTPNT